MYDLRASFTALRCAATAVLVHCVLSASVPAPAFADGGHGGGGGSSGSGSSGSGSSGSGSSGTGKTTSSLSSSDQALVRQAVADGDARALGEIIVALRRAAPGKILNISFEQGGSGYIYTFTVLTEAGRYIDVSLDAKTGTALSMKGR